MQGSSNSLVITVVSQKRAHGRYTLLCAQTGGWADICNITTLQRKAPMFTLSQPTAGYCTPTHTHVWQRSNIPGKGLAAPCAGKPSYVEKLIRIF